MLGNKQALLLIVAVLAAACGKVDVISIADLVGEAIIRSYRGDSVTSLFV